MVKNITTIIFNSLEVEKRTVGTNNMSFIINVSPIMIKNTGILKVSNFCHIGTGTNHTDNMYLFRIGSVMIDNSKYVSGVGSGNNPVILTTTFNNNRSLYDENIISLVKQTINTIEIFVDTYYPSVSLSSLTIANGGSGYTPNLTATALTFTGGGGSGAAGTFTTDASGIINSVSLTDAGSGYITPPTITFSAGAGSNGSIIASLNNFTSNGLVNSLNFSITFTIEQDEF